MKIIQVSKLYIQLNYNCNFRCRHCFHGDKLNNQQQMDFDFALSLLRYFKTNYNTTELVVLGGEPFLYDKLYDFILYAKHLNYKITICTNGFRIKKTLNKYNNAIDHLRLSLDGLEYTHDYIRANGSYNEIIDLLHGHYDFDISFTTVMNTLNCRELDGIAKLMSKYSIKELKLHHLRNIGNAKLNKDLLINDIRILSDICSNIEKIHKTHNVKIFVDENLVPSEMKKNWLYPIISENDRIEIEPNGIFNTTCFTVGSEYNPNHFNINTDKLTDLMDAYQKIRYYCVE